LSRIVRVLLLIAALALALPAQSAGIVEDVKALVEQGKSGQAYDLAARHPELLGDPAFDYYYGVAAVVADFNGSTNTIVRPVQFLNVLKCSTC
jgi:hypothetical protein